MVSPLRRLPGGRTLYKLFSALPLSQHLAAMLEDHEQARRGVPCVFNSVHLKSAFALHEMRMSCPVLPCCVGTFTPGVDST